MAAGCVLFGLVVLEVVLVDVCLAEIFVEEQQTSVDQLAYLGVWDKTELM